MSWALIKENGLAIKQAWRWRKEINVLAEDKNGSEPPLLTQSFADKAADTITRNLWCCREKDKIYSILLYKWNRRALKTWTFTLKSFLTPAQLHKYLYTHFYLFTKLLEVSVNPKSFCLLCSCFFRYWWDAEYHSNLNDSTLISECHMFGKPDSWVLQVPHEQCWKDEKEGGEQLPDSCLQKMRRNPTA